MRVLLPTDGVLGARHARGWLGSHRTVDRRTVSHRCHAHVHVHVLTASHRRRGFDRLAPPEDNILAALAALALAALAAGRRSWRGGGVGRFVHAEVEAEVEAELEVEVDAELEQVRHQLLVLLALKVEAGRR